MSRDVYFMAHHKFLFWLDSQWTGHCRDFLLSPGRMDQAVGSARKDSGQSTGYACKTTRSGWSAHFTVFMYFDHACQM